VKQRGPVLVTGAYGCIGAWVVRNLLQAKRDIVAFDVGGDRHRLRLVLDDHAISSVIHLAALQVPFCRADPPLGAHVNVVGTVNVFEAVRRSPHPVDQVVYASSIAAYDAIEAGSSGDAEMKSLPSTIYGVTKRANEGTAHVYWLDHRVSSIGIRPHTVFGPGRDQGLTSAPTVAMLAAAAGVAHHIPYGGRAQLQYAPDVARAFAAAADSAYRGASVHNLGGHLVHMRDVVTAIEHAAPEAEGLITFDQDTLLPFPERVESDSLAAVIALDAEPPFTEAVSDAVERFRDLLGRGLVQPPAVPDPH